MGNSASKVKKASINPNLKDKLIRMKKSNRVIQLRKKIYEEPSQGQHSTHVPKELNESKSRSSNHEKSVTEEKLIEGSSSSTSLHKNQNEGILALKFMGKPKQRSSDKEVKESDSTS